MSKSPVFRIMPSVGGYSIEHLYWALWIFPTWQTVRVGITYDEAATAVKKCGGELSNPPKEPRP